MKAERIYRGNIPADGTLIDSNDDWALYQRGTKDPAWFNFKVISFAPRTKKANFHLAYNVKTKKLANKHDAKVLAKAYPKLYEWIMATLGARLRTAVVEE